MHVRRGYLGWGVFLILTGAVPLLVRSGYLTGDQVDRLWTTPGYESAPVQIDLETRANAGACSLNPAGGCD
jgi:hypothetical protein